LIQPEKSRRKKASGGGSGSIGRSLTQMRIGSKDGASWRWQRLPGEVSMAIFRNLTSAGFLHTTGSRHVLDYDVQVPDLWDTTPIHGALEAGVRAVAPSL
jgi:hypothetical protein